MKLLRILLLLVFSSISALSNGQSIVGSWKKTGERLTKKDGKTTSSFNMIVKAMPCFANIVYTFSAGGKIKEQSADCAPSMMKSIGKELENSNWKLNGDQLTLQAVGAASPVKIAKYKVTFAGSDTMIWTFIYADNPGVPNITKAKQMQTTYKRQ